MSTSEFDTAGLPDIETISRIANQLFSAPPSADMAAGFSPTNLPGAPTPAGLPSSGIPLTGLPLGGFPAATPNTMASVPPAVPGTLKSEVPTSGNPPQGFGLPTEAQLAELLSSRRFPQSQSIAALGHATPPFASADQARYAEQVPSQTISPSAGSVPTAAPITTSSALASVPASRGSEYLGAGSVPTGFGLPSDAELQALLSPNQFNTPASLQRHHPSLQTDHGGGFYFLDHAPVREGNVPVPHQVNHQTGAAIGQAPFDINLVRRDFPILRETVNGRPLIWLDNAATTQKPSCVIELLSYFYEHENSNIHRAAHELAARATDAYEGAREKVRGFLNAASANEIVFVRGATEAINLVAQSWGRQFIGKDDEIIISWLEHHANVVPWQQLCAEKGARLRVIPVDEDGQVILEEYAKLLTPRTKLVSFTQVSNALGTITPAKTMVEMAHRAGAKVLVDGAQAVSHLRADVQYLDCDWYVFSGHKVFGPTGIGVLYGKEALLNETQPWQGGGNMIKDVTFEHTQYHAAPGRFEAGTGNIADAVGLGAAIDYVNKIGIDNINLYEHQLLLYAIRLLKDIPGLRLIGTAPDKASVLSFVLEGFKTEEVGAALNLEGIAVRSGHHCAQPVLRRFGLESTVRPSLAFYNNCADVDTLVAAITRIKSGRYSVRH